MYAFAAPGQPRPVVLHLTGGPHHGTTLLGDPITDHIRYGSATYVAFAHHDSSRTVWLSYLDSDRRDVTRSWDTDLSQQTGSPSQEHPMPTFTVDEACQAAVDAQAAYMKAADAFAAAATAALTFAARAQYPDATTIRVTAILEHDYTEHDVQAYADDHNLGPVDLDVDDLLLLTEGVCVDGADLVSIPL